MIDWGMGIVTEHLNSGWIIIPIYQYKVLKTYFMRSTFSKDKRYGSYPRDNVFFGLDKSYDTTRKIYITEGIFDAIFFMRTGNQCIAALSNRLSKYHLEILKYYEEIVIVPDNDIPGRELVSTAFPLIHNCKVNVCTLPLKHKDVAECSLEELYSSIEQEIPAQNYLSNIAQERFLCKL
jgi:DNA primase